MLRGESDTPMGDVLGVIGLGRMGGPIADRLVRGGHTVVGYDAAGTHRDREGLTAAASVAEVARSAEIVFLSLPHQRASADVCSTIAETSDRAVDTVVELSTIGLDGAAAAATTLKSAGVRFIDAPVSGGIAGASTGRLSMMVAATDEALAGRRELLQEVAQRCFVVGTRPGQGQAMKLINNYVSQTALAATAEAAVFAERVGLDLTQMVDVLNVSTGRSSASEDKFPRAVIPRTYDFGFASEAARKDIGLYLAGAEAVGVPRGLAEASDALWGRFLDACPGTDFTYIHKYLEDGGA